MPLKQALALNGFCHAAGIAFVRAETRGVCASVFTDFGPSFTVLDVDGGACMLLRAPCLVLSQGSLQMGHKCQCMATCC